MSDGFGAITLPVAGSGATAAISDPLLNTLLDFLKTVFIADLGTAWAAVSPTIPIVRAVFAHSPRERSFSDTLTPAIYLFRTAGAETEDWTASEAKTTQTLTLQWVFEPANQDKQRQRDPIVNGLNKALGRALRNGRHPAWVLTADEADPDAVKLATATSTSAQSYSGAELDGVIGAGVVDAPRPLTVTTAPAPGAYNTTDPITFTGLDEPGADQVESITLTGPDGGETIGPVWRYASTSQVDLPAMLLTTGSISIGYAESPDVALGSLILDACGASRIRLSRQGVAKDLAIAIKDAPAKVYQMVEFELRVEELLTEDAAANYDALEGADGGEAMGVTILFEDGTEQGSQALE